MSEVAVAALVAALLCGLGGLAVPALIRRVPEPDPAPEPRDGEPPKESYADIADRPGLGWRAAVAAALVGALLGWATGPDWSLLWLVPLVPVGVALAVIDWRTRLLPRRVVWPATGLALLLVVAAGLATGDRDALVRALIGMVVAFAFFYVLWWVYPGGIGYGDVRLSLVVGLVLGWVGWGALAIGLWVGFASFGLPGLVLAVVRWDRKLMKKSFPFGPFMLLGTVVGLVWGTALAARIWG